MSDLQINLNQMSDSEKDALILELWAQPQAAQPQARAGRVQAQASQVRIEELEAKVRELEVLLAKPPKTLSVPPSKGRKPNKKKGRNNKPKPRPGKGRKLHPKPDRTVVAWAETCPHRGADLAGAAQRPQAVYDRIELPAVRPHVTWVDLYGCDCPKCGQPVMATPLEELPRGSPFGKSIARLATYLHYLHAISYQRLQALFADLRGLYTRQGGLANLFRRVQHQLAGAVDEITEDVRSSRVVKSDETGARVDGCKAWEWVFTWRGHGAARDRGEPGEVQAGGGASRGAPEVWVADLFGSQQGHGELGQVWLAHQLRDVQYAVGAGDIVFAAETLTWLHRAIRVGQKHEELDDAALEWQRQALLESLEALLALEPEQANGQRPCQRPCQRYAKFNESLRLSMTDCEVSFTDNESEREAAERDLPQGDEHPALGAGCGIVRGSLVT